MKMTELRKKLQAKLRRKGWHTVDRTAVCLYKFEDPSSHSDERGIEVQLGHIWIKDKVLIRTFNETPDHRSGVLLSLDELDAICQIAHEVIDKERPYLKKGVIRGHRMTNQESMNMDMLADKHYGYHETVYDGEGEANGT